MEFLDLENAKRPGREQKRVNADFPVWIQSLYKEAKRLGVTRQSIIKILSEERLKHIGDYNKSNFLSFIKLLIDKLENFCIL